MDTVLQAIVEPHRRAILELVREHERTVGEIAARFEVTRPAISQHLRVLKDAGLVVDRADGTRRFYRARPEGLAELRAYLDAFWDPRLEALKQAAEAEERSHSNARRRTPEHRRGRGERGDARAADRRQP